MNYRIRLSRNSDHGNPDSDPTSSGQNGAAGRVWWRRSRARTARRGVTLIEAVLFISVALSLIVGGLQFYKQVQMAARIQTQVRVLSGILSETRVLYQNTRFQDLTTIDDVLVASKAVPPHIVRPWYDGINFLLMNEWGDNLQIALSPLTFGTEKDINTIYINLYRIPVEACSRLAVVDSLGQGLFSNGFLRVIYTNPKNSLLSYSKTYPPNPPDQAARDCKDNSDNGLVNLSFRFRANTQ